MYLCYNRVQGQGVAERQLNGPLLRQSQQLINCSKLDVLEVFLPLSLNDGLRKALSAQSRPLQCLQQSQKFNVALVFWRFKFRLNLFQRLMFDLDKLAIYVLVLLIKFLTGEKRRKNLGGNTYHKMPPASLPVCSKCSARLEGTCDSATALKLCQERRLPCPHPPPR